MQDGVVKWFDDEKGFGFIEQDIGKDLFVHYSDINQDGYKTLEEGQEVKFVIEETEKGLAAKSVTITSGDQEIGVEDGSNSDGEGMSNFDIDSLEKSMTNP